MNQTEDRDEVKNVPAVIPPFVPDPDFVQTLKDGIECVSDFSQLRELEGWIRSCLDRPSEETDDEIARRIEDRFEIISLLTEGCILGQARSLIVSGPAGVGKSWTVERTLLDADPEGVLHTVSKGYLKATGLIRLLWDHRFPRMVLVLDDTDTVFHDETSLNILKSVCDTTQRRIVRWGSEMVFYQEDGTTIDKPFEFEGAVIFITNYDLDAMIDKGHKLSPHLAALVSRSHYIDTTMHGLRDYIVRIKRVIAQGVMLSDLSEEEKKDVVDFIVKHQRQLREVSLRIALKIGSLRKVNYAWEKLARVTCLR